MVSLEEETALMSNITNDYESVKHKVRALLDKQTNSGHHRLRAIKDALARHSIAIGGLSVIAAVVMIFFYLLYVVFPIFKGAELIEGQGYELSVAEADSVALSGLEEYGEISFQVKTDGQVNYFYVADGTRLEALSIELPEATEIVQAHFANRERGVVALGLSSGDLLLAKLAFKISYPNNKRTITPQIEYPFGNELLRLSGEPLKKLAVSLNEDALSITGLTATNRLVFQRYLIEESFLSGDFTLEQEIDEQITTNLSPDFLLHDPTGNWAYLISKTGEIESYLFDDESLVLNERKSIASKKAPLSEVQFLLGGYSLLIGYDSGEIRQYFPVRDEQNIFRLELIRSFDAGNSKVTQIIPEIRRKGFYSLNEQGDLGVFFATSHRKLLNVDLFDSNGASQQVLVNPRGHTLLALQNNRVRFFEVDNEHPDLSWSALWGKVWYESYPEPDYTWQSSASNTDFEAKFSLVPLSFGTLKAAFYAMLFAMPLAICGAIFTAYFMAPKMRTLVKPAVEIMEALPTVILGFLAGLWLAPIMEDNLPGVFLILMILPIAIISFGLVWHVMPHSIKGLIPTGWQAALLMPVIVIVSYLCLTASYPVEQAFFGGDMRVWLGEIGIDYDQRNSLVVGIAMGFAVIPTIFSIAEDAIFSVPNQLTNGSLALGASPWQTLVRVVLPTASPGIFSGVMIGLGRAVGETMIVLMATGNTPIMEANIFEGMRTLSANIAVEMPESEVGSSHYRVLFLAGFVLFVFTFVFNTLAENIRHRLRRKYGSL